VRSRTPPSLDPRAASSADRPSPGEVAPSTSSPSYEDRRRAFIEAEAERAAAPYKGLFPPDVLEAFKERTAIFLATHPEMIRLIDVALPPPEGHKSEARPIEEGAPAASVPPTEPSPGAGPRKPRDKR
jgi:hypothetical protein